MKQLENPKKKPQGFSPCPAIQEKINPAAKQFREHHDKPCVVVLYSDALYRSLRTTAVASAAFGLHIYQDPPFLGPIDPGPVRYRFEGKAKLKRAQNRTVSAVVVLSPCQLHDLWLQVWKRLYAKQQSCGSVDHGDQYKFLQEISQHQPVTIRYEGTFRAIVYHNPFARHPLAVDLFVGRFDQPWNLDRTGWYGPLWMGAELAKLHSDEGVPTATFRDANQPSKNA